MKLTGKINSFLFRNEQSLHTVLILKTVDKYVTVVGPTKDLEKGDSIEVEGQYETHKTYGMQFKITSCTRCIPDSIDTLASYISNNVKGIGIKTAKKIVAKFGEDTVDVIRYSKEKLYEIKKLKKGSVDLLEDFFNTEWDKWNSIKYLTSLNISMVTAVNIYKQLGVNTISSIKENPYSILDYMKANIDFKSIDRIGKNQGIAQNDLLRLEYGVLYTLDKIINFGHTCVTLSDLITNSKKNLLVQEEEITNAIASLKMKEKIYVQIIDDIEYVFRKSYYIAEENIAKKIFEYSKQKIGSKDYSKLEEQVSEKLNIVLSDEQKKAISVCLNSKASVITGGPGTGKTTIIKTLIEILNEKKTSYVLCAPTGRAAKRITETTGKEAKTLHRMLEINKVQDEDIDMFLNYEVKHVDEDVIIVDEASMIDTLMMNNLLKSVSVKTTIILVGDIFQLPSVGPGSILKDIIDSNLIPVVKLKEIFRQSAKSDIIVNAHKVNEGKMIEFKNKDTDFFYIPCEDLQKGKDIVLSLLSTRLPNTYNIDCLKDIQVLCPTKKQELGTVRLNEDIQQILNPKKKNTDQVYSNGKYFRVNDKVMQIINNYDKEDIEKKNKVLGVYNGDIGYIIKISNEEKKLVVDYGDKKIEYSFEQLEELELAYAITVHKSQGSEFDYVILPILTGFPKLLTRNLLYTAITRAKKMLVLVGNQNLIAYMINNNDEQNRKTGLKHKLDNLAMNS